MPPVITASTTINASPEAVAEVLVDPVAAPLWTEGLDHIEVVAGQPGEPGWIGRAHYVEGGRRYMIQDHLIEAEANRHYRSNLTGGELSIVVDTTLEDAQDGRTQLDVRWEGHGNTPFARFILPLMRRRIARRAQCDLAALRRVVEDSH